MGLYDDVDVRAVPVEVAGRQVPMAALEHLVEIDEVWGDAPGVGQGSAG